jgi:PadR family transcriptional regulator, regulatory protein PadR
MTRLDQWQCWSLSVLHGLEKKGYLLSHPERSGRRARQVYEATPEGREALALAKIKVKALFGELFEGNS